MNQYIPSLLAALPPSAVAIVLVVIFICLLFFGRSGVASALRKWSARFDRWADRVERLSRVRLWLKGLCVRILLALADLLQRAANSGDGGGPPQLGPADEEPPTL